MEDNYCVQSFSFSLSFPISLHFNFNLIKQRGQHTKHPDAMPVEGRRVVIVFGEGGRSVVPEIWYCPCLINWNVCARVDVHVPRRRQLPPKYTDKLHSESERNQKEQMNKWLDTREGEFVDVCSTLLINSWARAHVNECGKCLTGDMRQQCHKINLMSHQMTTRRSERGRIWRGISGINWYPLLVRVDCLMSGTGTVWGWRCLDSEGTNLEGYHWMTFVIFV